MSETLVSVVLPVYNEPRYLGEAIESVLRQGESRVEFIVVDDGSTDETATVAKSFGDRIEYRYQENAGPGPARNLGIELSTGAFLAFCDADDLWMPRKLELQLAVLETEPELEAVYCHVEQFHTPELDPASLAPIVEKKRILPSALPTAMLIRREAIERVGLFDPRWSAADLGWSIKARDRGLRTRTLPEILYRRRIHDRNMSVLSKTADLERLRVIKNAMDRRRGHGEGK